MSQLVILLGGVYIVEVKIYGMTIWHMGAIAAKLYWVLIKGKIYEF